MLSVLKEPVQNRATVNGLRLLSKVGLNLPVLKKRKKDEKRTKATIQEQKRLRLRLGRAIRAHVLWALDLQDMLANVFYILVFVGLVSGIYGFYLTCLLYTSPSPRDS